MPAQKASPAPQSASHSTRDHLLEAGLTLMRKQGYGATGLQEILKAAGVPKGSFYHHFDSKEAFTVAVVERYHALEGEHRRQVLVNSRRPPLKRLRRYFEELVEKAFEGPAIETCLLGRLSLETAGVSRLLHKQLSSSFKQWQSFVAAVIEEAMEKHELPPSTIPASLAGFILDSWEGALVRSQADRSDLPLKNFLHYVFDELLAR